MDEITVFDHFRLYALQGTYVTILLSQQYHGRTIFHGELAEVTMRNIIMVVKEIDIGKRRLSFPRNKIVRVVTSND